MFCLFILYVSDQNKSKEFYQSVLNCKPTLDVTGMTEFTLNENAKLGLMPEKGIAKILGDKVPHPSKGNGLPRAEVYLYFKGAIECFDRAVKLNAKLIQEPVEMDWGHRVAYVADSDGHILAFAEDI